MVVIDSVITAAKMEFEDTRKDLQSKESKIGSELGQINTYENEQKLLHNAVMTLSNYEEIQ